MDCGVWKKRTMLSARACGGKVGAGTVEAEEKNTGGRCVHMVGFFCCLRGQIPRTDRRTDREGVRAVCAILSLHLFMSWLEG